jgi:hypothetical protein
MVIGRAGQVWAQAGAVAASAASRQMANPGR